jgi:tryptophanyl-tRNA synthetase
MHITSNVTGRLAPGKTAFDALRACLPAGTVSGAPKVRAMQIIDEIEPHRRGPYAGAVGFVDFTGNLETCLALRTMVFQGPKSGDGAAEAVQRKVYIQAGAGIVYDSVPVEEYAETINKAKGLLKAIEVAEEWRYAMSGRPVEVLSCIQPTGEMHIGNYFGAVANWVALQETRRCVYGIVDLHSMTMPYDPAVLRRNTESMVVDLLACGLDPEKSILFLQSLVPEHTELAWLLGCVCPVGELRRMTQFKEKSEEQSGEFVSAGLLTYPILQAADVLIYRARYVPVGQDQEQHLELSRVIARRFNQQFGTDYFPEPQPLFTESPKIMSLVDPGKKMSKSAGPKHYIGLFEDEQSIRDKVRSAVTDTGASSGSEMSPGVANLFVILQACGKGETAAALRKEHQAGKRRYSDLKETVADALVELTGRFRRRRQEILGSGEAVGDMVRRLSEKAREIARQTLRDVRAIAGLP